MKVQGVDRDEKASMKKTPVLLFEETFDAAPTGRGLPEGWWSEGGATVAAKHGLLVQNADPEAGAASQNSVIWINQEFEGDIRFEADVKVLSAQGDVNDIVVFLLFSDPEGTPLYDTRRARASGQQGMYTAKLSGYVFFYWGKSGTTTPANIRFRECPGGQLLLERDAYSVEAGRAYRLAIEKQASVLRLYVDGKKLAEHDLSGDDWPKPIHQKGLIGLKTWRTQLAWDNVRIRRLP
jgi:hypothetical protein